MTKYSFQRVKHELCQTTAPKTPRGGAVAGAVLQMQPHTYKFFKEKQVQVESHNATKPHTPNSQLSPKKFLRKN
jgi:hypothetical protein